MVTWCSSTPDPPNPHRGDSGHRDAQSVCTFAINAPGPNAAAAAATVSTDAYDSEQRAGSMPSLTLRSGGNVVKRHIPVMWPFGMTPKLLMWIFGCGFGIRGLWKCLRAAS